MSPIAPTALIAEDEPLLAAALQAELVHAWPALQIAATVGDGASAVCQALALQPDVLFFDIRMPGQSGLEAAAELADAWPVQDAAAKPFPALVFVTAYDQYAVQAFEAQAMDYLLKPVQPARLKKTMEKLQAALAKPAQNAIDFEAILDQLRGLMERGLPDQAPHSTRGTPPLLQVIQASVPSPQGSSVRIVPIEEVLCFEAADKYVRVLTAEHEYLIRTPLKELQTQLDAQVFWQIHRGTVVRALAVETITRDEAGKTVASLRGLKEKFVVSRIYSHRFKAM